MVLLFVISLEDKVLYDMNNDIGVYKSSYIFTFFKIYLKKKRFLQRLLAKP